MVDATVASERRDFYVYVIFRPNGVPCYVGKGTGDRWKRHPTKSHSQRLKRIFDAASGKLPTVIVRDGLTNAAACETEIALIAAIGHGKAGPLVNVTPGGDGSAGYFWPDEAKEKLKAFWASDAGRAEKEKRGVLARKQMSSPDQVAKLVARNKTAPQRGKKFDISPAERTKRSQRIAEINRGRSQTAEHRERLAAGRRAFWADPIKREQEISRKKKWAAENLDRVTAVNNQRPRGKNGQYVSTGAIDDPCCRDTIRNE